MLKEQKSGQAMVVERAEELRIAIVRSSYHGELTQNLTDLCVEELVAGGVVAEQVTVVDVPGSWEVPLAVEGLAKSGEYDAIVTFGIIVKGDTYHFDMIANEVGRALMDTQIRYGIPVIFEVLAVFDKADAERRASRDQFNKGIEAGRAALGAIAALRKIRS